MSRSGRAVAQVLEPDEADVRLHLPDDVVQLAFLDKGPRAENETDFRGAAGGDQIEGAGGEVQHRHDPARRLHRHEGDRGAVGVGQHEADRLARRRARGDLAREQGDAEAKTALLERPGDRVLEDHAAARALPRAVLEGLEERAPSSSSWRTPGRT